MFKKLIALLISVVFLVEQTGYAQVAPQMGVPQYLQGLVSADKFRPMHLRSVSFKAEKDSLKVLLEQGDERKVKQDQVEEAAGKLLEYFRVGLALPNSTFWVNLRPGAADEVIDPLLEKTDLGKVLLEADLQLKKDMAALTSPNTPQGRQYWNKLYERAESLFAGEEAEIPTYNRPWIVPGEIILGVGQDNTAYIYKATLNVCLEQDWPSAQAKPQAFSDPRLKELNEYSAQLIRSLILPKLTRQINSSKKYAHLRQVYYSLVLSQWFKQKFSQSPAISSGLVSSIDSKNISSLSSKQAWSKDTYFKAYQASFKQGEYNREETFSGPAGLTVRRYFSGGFKMPELFAQTQSSIAASNVTVVAITRPIAGSFQAVLAPGGQLTLSDNADGGMKLKTNGKAHAKFTGGLVLTIFGTSHTLTSLMNLPVYAGDAFWLGLPLGIASFLAGLYLFKRMGPLYDIELDGKKIADGGVAESKAQGVLLASAGALLIAASGVCSAHPYAWVSAAVGTVMLFGGAVKIIDNGKDGGSAQELVADMQERIADISRRETKIRALEKSTAPEDWAEREIQVNIKKVDYGMLGKDALELRHVAPAAAVLSLRTAETAWALFDQEEEIEQLRQREAVGAVDHAYEQAVQERDLNHTKLQVLLFDLEKTLAKVKDGGAASRDHSYFLEANEQKEANVYRSRVRLFKQEIEDLQDIVFGDEDAQGNSAMRQDMLDAAHADLAAAEDNLKTVEARIEKLWKARDGSKDRDGGYSLDLLRQVADSDAVLSYFIEEEFSPDYAEQAVLFEQYRRSLELFVYGALKAEEDLRLDGTVGRKDELYLSETTIKELLKSQLGVEQAAEVINRADKVRKFVNGLDGLEWDLSRLSRISEDSTLERMITKMYPHVSDPAAGKLAALYRQTVQDVCARAAAKGATGLAGILSVVNDPRELGRVIAVQTHLDRDGGDADDREFVRVVVSASTGFTLFGIGTAVLVLVAPWLNQVAGPEAFSFGVAAGVMAALAGLEHLADIARKRDQRMLQDRNRDGGLAADVFASDLWLMHVQNAPQMGKFRTAIDDFRSRIFTVFSADEAKTAEERLAESEKLRAGLQGIERYAVPFDPSSVFLFDGHSELKTWDVIILDGEPVLFIDVLRPFDAPYSWLKQVTYLSYGPFIQYVRLDPVRTADGVYYPDRYIAWSDLPKHTLAAVPVQNRVRPSRDGGSVLIYPFSQAWLSIRSGDPQKQSQGLKALEKELVQLEGQEDLIRESLKHGLAKQDIKAVSDTMMRLAAKDIENRLNADPQFAMFLKRRDLPSARYSIVRYLDIRWNIKPLSVGQHVRRYEDVRNGDTLFSLTFTGLPALTVKSSRVDTGYIGQGIIKKVSVEVSSGGLDELLIIMTLSANKAARLEAIHKIGELGDERASAALIMTMLTSWFDRQIRSACFDAWVKVGKANKDGGKFPAGVSQAVFDKLEEDVLFRLGFHDTQVQKFLGWMSAEDFAGELRVREGSQVVLNALAPVNEPLKYESAIEMVRSGTYAVYAYRVDSIIEGDKLFVLYPTDAEYARLSAASGVVQKDGGRAVSRQQQEKLVAAYLRGFEGEFAGKSIYIENELPLLHTFIGMVRALEAHQNLNEDYMDSMISAGLDAVNECLDKLSYRVNNLPASHQSSIELEYVDRINAAVDNAIELMIGCGIHVQNDFMVLHQLISGRKSYVGLAIEIGRSRLDVVKERNKLYAELSSSASLENFTVTLQKIEDLQYLVPGDLVSFTDGPALYYYMGRRGNILELETYPRRERLPVAVNPDAFNTVKVVPAGKIGLDGQNRDGGESLYDKAYDLVVFIKTYTDQKVYDAVAIESFLRAQDKISEINDSLIAKAKSLNDDRDIRVTAVLDHLLVIARKENQGPKLDHWALLRAKQGGLPLEVTTEDGQVQSLYVGNYAYPGELKDSLDDGDLRLVYFPADTNQLEFFMGDSVWNADKSKVIVRLAVNGEPVFERRDGGNADSYVQKRDGLTAQIAQAVETGDDLSLEHLSYDYIGLEMKTKSAVNAGYGVSRILTQEESVAKIQRLKKASLQTLVFNGPGSSFKAIAEVEAGIKDGRYQMVEYPHIPYFGAGQDGERTVDVFFSPTGWKAYFSSENRDGGIQKNMNGSGELLNWLAKAEVGDKLELDRIPSLGELKELAQSGFDFEFGIYKMEADSEKVLIVKGDYNQVWCPYGVYGRTVHFHANGNTIPPDHEFYRAFQREQYDYVLTKEGITIYGISPSNGDLKQKIGYYILTDYPMELAQELEEDEIHFKTIPWEQVDQSAALHFKSSWDFEDELGLVMKKDGGEKQEIGGIDLRALPLNAVPMNPAQVVPVSVSSVPLAALDKEWAQIVKQMQSGPMPYAAIKAHVQQSCGRQETAQHLQEVSACVMQILEMEEDAAVVTAPELKEVLCCLS